MPSQPAPAESPNEAPVDPTDGFERAVIERLYDGVYYVDRGRRIRNWNAGAERLTGYAASTVVGQFCH
jgi:PAS domain-containing protein